MATTHKTWRGAPPPAINSEMERAALGGLMIVPEHLVEAAKFLRAEDFFETRHQIIYAAMLALLEKNGTPPDVVQLDEYLREHKLLASVGTSAYTNALVNTCPSISRTIEYCRTVFILSLERQRRLIDESLSLNGITREEGKQRHARIDEREAAASSPSGASHQPEETFSDGEVQPFPIDVYPAKLQTFIEEAARSINCPPDFIGAPLLSFLGAALGNAVCVEIKPGWKELPRIWLALVAQPGDKKSPALNVIDQFFHERQETLSANWRKKYDEWKLNMDGSPEPVMEQVITTDATLEALSDLLQNNPRGMLFARDELTGWALSMNQYKNGKGADRQNWLSFWNGASSTINRRNRKHAVVLNRPFVGVVGTLQPDVLGDLSDERGRQDGFIHRILFAYPDHLPRKWTEDELSHKTVDGVRMLFDLLWSVPMAKDESGRIGPHVHRFTKAGKEAWVTWLNEHYAEQEAQDFPDNLYGPWAKMEGYAARIALILHISRSLCNETKNVDIDEVSMAGAVKLINYFKSHVRRVYAQLYTPAEERIVSALLAWIRRQKSRVVTAREVCRSGIRGIKNSDDAKYLLEQLAERGYGTVEEVAPKRGRKVFRFTLDKDTQHPTVDIKASAQAGSAA